MFNVSKFFEPYIITLLVVIFAILLLSIFGIIFSNQISHREIYYEHAVTTLKETSYFLLVSVLLFIGLLIYRCIVIYRETRNSHRNSKH